MHRSRSDFNRHRRVPCAARVAMTGLKKHIKPVRIGVRQEARGSSRAGVAEGHRSVASVTTRAQTRLPSRGKGAASRGAVADVAPQDAGGRGSSRPLSGDRRPSY